MNPNLDTSFWRLEIFKKQDIKWFEIDFSKKIENKLAILGNSEYFYSVYGDLRNIDDVHETLTDKGLDFNRFGFNSNLLVLNN